MASPVLVSVSRGKYSRRAREMENLGRRLVRALNKKDVTAEVHLVSDPEMRGLNRRFRGRNRVTNVLSFGAGPPFIRPDLGRGARYLGEIFLAPDYAARSGNGLDFLLVHGFLHLLGYTHGGKRDRMEMEKLEERVCRKLEIRSIHV